MQNRLNIFIAGDVAGDLKKLASKIDKKNFEIRVEELQRKTKKSNNKKNLLYNFMKKLAKEN